MRTFLSPQENRLLDQLEPTERGIVRDLFDQLNARLVEDTDPLHRVTVATTRKLRRNQT